MVSSEEQLLASHGSSFQKTFMGAAGSGGAGLDITDVFSTYLYTGTGSNRTITNGIDLSGEGGLVWSKIRPDTDKHMLIDTERGINKTISSNDSGSQSTDSNTITAISTSGYTLSSHPYINANNKTFVSWTWRKAPKFFDMVTYTGSGSAKTVAHSLGSAPGMIMIKKISASGSWVVYHRANTAAPETDYLVLNSTSATVDHVNYWNDTAPTDSVFTVGTESWVNTNGATYVAYLFAHNDGDGEFGPDSDQDIIKCGSYTGNGSSNGPEIDLGFEPQWVMVKRADSGSEHWAIIDNMRRMISLDGNNALMLKPNNSETEEYVGFANPLPTGFKVSRDEGVTNASGGTYIYMAIRRGPLAPPEAATEVFAVDTADGGTLPQYKSGFVTDMALRVNNLTSSHNNFVYSRLTEGKYLLTENTNAEGSSTAFTFDYMNGYTNLTSTDSNNYSWMWKRAPNFFDVVAYEGDGVTGSAGAISHNLGVTPDMIWGKNRGSGTWNIYHKDILSSDSNGIVLFDQNPSSSNNGQFYYGDQSVLVPPTATEVTLGSAMKSNGADFVMYLFATLAGISKVGSVSHSGSSTDVNCGFSNGARFVMLKRTDATGDWYIWDSVRGIIAGNDPYLLLNTTAAQVTNTDYIDPLSSGFQISGAFTDGDYIFYAIA